MGRPVGERKRSGSGEKKRIFVPEFFTAWSPHSPTLLASTPISSPASSLSPQLQQLVTQWLTWDSNPTTRQEIQALVAKGNVKELQDCLGTRIAFGTAGLRARMRAGFKYMNDLIIRQTSQGLASHLLAVGGATYQRQGFVIGYDGRHNSKRWAHLTAAVFLSKGFKVYLYSRLAATPLVAFGVGLTRACGGVMVTASHNPKQDNGYKVYWGNACQIIPPHDENIADAILRHLQPQPLALNFEDEAAIRAHALCVDPTAAHTSAYLQEVAAKCCFTPQQNAQDVLPIVFTAMHGVGHHWCEQSFKVFGLPAYIPTKEQQEPDPEFPTVDFPNPEEGKGALKLAIETAERHRAPVILAVDPDADRLAVAERLHTGTQADAAASLTDRWIIFNGNQIGALLANWLWRQHQRRHPHVPARDCVMLSTAVSSKLLRAMSEKEGFEFHETLTGFKWMGNVADKLRKQGKRIIFAYEEAIGFMCGDVCWDKDGVRGAPVMAELARHVYAKGGTLQEELQAVYRQYGFFSIQTKYFFCYDPNVMEAIFQRLRQKYQEAGTGLLACKRVRDQTTGYDNGENDGKTKLPVTPRDHMITYFFQNGCVATLRGSGTEPKLKYYVECVSQESLARAEKLRQDMMDAIVAELLEPKKNKLVEPRS
eukprot:g79856.t1